MTQDRPTISVVIVSRGRPASLSLCLMGVARRVYAPYEIVVVADAVGLDAARALPFAAALKLVAFDEANISAACNAGVLAATVPCVDWPRRRKWRIYQVLANSCKT